MNSLAGGIWHNEFGFDLRDTGRKVNGCPPWRKRVEYEYTADTDHPMTFQESEFCFVQPDTHGTTDMGSVPEMAQWLLIPKDLHNPSFIMHDSACRQRKLYWSSKLNGVYVPCYISSGSAAELLGRCLYAAGYQKRAYIVYHAVKRFGPQW